MSLRIQAAALSSARPLQEQFGFTSRSHATTKHSARVGLFAARGPDPHHCDRCNETSRQKYVKHPRSTQKCMNHSSDRPKVSSTILRASQSVLHSQRSRRLFPGREGYLAQPLYRVVTVVRGPARRRRRRSRRSRRCHRQPAGR